MPFAKGKSGNPKGRRKGSPNKITSDVKAALIAAANNAGQEGGMEAYFTKLANENPSAFAALMGKLIPLQVGSDPEAPAPIVEVRRIIVDASDTHPERFQEAEFPPRALG